MVDSSWLEVSLTVEPELAEAVAEVLSRYAKNGVVIESTAVSADEENRRGYSVGPLRVVAYLSMADDIEETRQKIDESFWYLGRIRPLPQTEYRLVHETDWSLAWKENYHPIPVGERLLILPAWIDDPDGERIPIRMDPGMAFGTGTHPTTQLCLQILEEYLTSRRLEPDDSLLNNSGVNVIDIGCGSGILSVGAVKLGALRARGVDTDPLAVEIARENVELNQVSDRVEVGEGSLEEILKGAFTLSRAHLVLTNILAPVLVKLLDQGLAQLLDQDGLLVLSGIIEDQMEEILTAAVRNGLQIERRVQIDDWVALGLKIPDGGEITVES